MESNRVLTLLSLLLKRVEDNFIFFYDVMEGIILLVISGLTGISVSFFSFYSLSGIFLRPHHPGGIRGSPRWASRGGC